QSLVEIGFIGQVVGRYVVPGVPIVLVQAADLPVNTGFDGVVQVDPHLHGDGNFVPAQNNHRGVGLDVVKIVGQSVVEFGGLWLHGYAQCVFILLVAEASPGG